ncbi:phospholipase A2 [Microplitis demolitor]|uniref:phospholipase A2 n=1 Tax=Microplitis demolitor TaxID=69319 RepID=UPI0004CD4A46|nr:phospholipase A2 [Microplitis demolitor]
MQLFYLLIFISIHLCVSTSNKNSNRDVSFPHSYDTDKNIERLNPRFRIKRSKPKVIGIFPGTKWCGPGNIAKHTNDFGPHRGTDQCCRNHDYCEPKIPKKDNRYGIENNGSLPILSCMCDLIFYNCLTTDNSATSRTVGSLYFNSLHGKCFYFDTDDETYKLIRIPNFNDNSVINFKKKFTKNASKNNQRPKIN